MAKICRGFRVPAARSYSCMPVHVTGVHRTICEAES